MRKCAGTPSILLVGIFILILLATPGCTKTSSLGAEWERTFDGLTPVSVTQGTDGGYTIGCSNCILLISSDGHLLSDRPFSAGSAFLAQPTPDGGYICAGRDELVKMDYQYDVEWKAEPVEYDILSIEQTADGGYVLAGCAGYTNDYKYTLCTAAIHLARTDSVADLQWEKVIAIDGLCDERPVSVEQTTDGGYIILACSNSPGSWLGYCGPASLIKTDSDGNVVWVKTFDGGSLYSIQQTPDGGYVMGGRQWGTSEGEVDLGWLVKTASTGDTEWEKTFASGEFYSVHLTADGGYILGGGEYNDNPWSPLPWLVKTDSGGELQWQKTFGRQYQAEQERRDKVISVQQTSDGGYIVLAVKEHFDHNDDLWLMKIEGD